MLWRMIAIGWLFFIEVQQAASEPSAIVSEVSRFAIAPPTPVTKVVVHNSLGDVRVEGHAGTDIQIVAEKQAATGRDLDLLRVTVVPVRDGSVRVQTEARGNVPNAGAIHLRIMVPHSALVHAETSRGALVLANLDEGAWLEAQTGTVRLENVQGSVDARVELASLEMQDVFGAIDAAVLRGDVDLEGIAGPRLVVSTGTGRISARRIMSGFVEIMTTSGDILIDGAMPPGASWRIGSIRGSVDSQIGASGGLLVLRGRELDAPGLRGTAFSGRFGAEVGNVTLQLTSRGGRVRYRAIETATPAVAK